MTIEQSLSGGDPRTLKGVDKVIKAVIDNPKRLDELFNCLFVSDEVVRMRTSDALEKICRQHGEWLKPYSGRILREVSKIRQASVQWHVAQMLVEIPLSETETAQAIRVLQNNLKVSDDWIVTNLTLESLAAFARKGSFPKDTFVRILKKYQTNRHNSVKARVRKLLAEFAHA